MKTFLIILSVVIILVGVALVFFTLVANDFDFRKIGKDNSVTTSYEISDGFESLVILDALGYHDVKIEKSGSDKCEIVHTGKDYVRLDREVNDGALVLKTVNTKGFFGRFSLFDFSSSQITVSVPEKEYEKLTVDTASGDVRISGLNAKSVTVDTASAGVYLNDMTLETLTLETTSGDISLTDVIVSGKAEIELTSGDSNLNNLSVGSLEIETGSGDVKIRDLFAEGSVDIETVSGDVEIFKANAKSLSIDVTSGDIELQSFLATESITLEAASGEIDFDSCDALKIRIETTSGDVDGTLLTAKSFDAKASSGDVRVPSNDGNGGTCFVRTGSGDIVIRIAD